MFSNGSRSKYNCPIWKERRHATAEHRSTAAGNWLLINWVTGARKRFQEPREVLPAQSKNLSDPASRRPADNHARSAITSGKHTTAYVSHFKMKRKLIYNLLLLFWASLCRVESVTTIYRRRHAEAHRRQRLTLIRNGILTIFPFGVFGVISGKCQLFSNPIKDSP